MIRLDEAAALHRAGAKARTLARARAAGLPVLDGFVVLPDEELDAAALAAALARLGGARFVVRSSATVEDLPGASAAGVFDSVVDVPAAAVEAAITRVRDSAHRHAARAYLGARGLAERRVEMAVLVQPLAAAATALGVLHTAPVVDGTVAAEERAPGEPEFGMVTPRRLGLDDPAVVAARAMAAIVGGEADVEYARTPSGPLLLQARPLVGVRREIDAEELARWRLDEAGEWWLDAEHNPAPLSAAQCSLVDRLEAEPGLPRQRVVRGWLYVRRDPPPADEQPATSAAALRTLLTERIEPEAERILAPLERRAPPPLDESLAAFVAVVRLHVTEVRPAISRARRRLDELLQRSIGEPLAAHGELLAATGARTAARDQALWSIGRAPDEPTRLSLLSRALAAFGAYAPAWDVRVPSDDEAPDRVLAAASLLARADSPEQRHPAAEERAQAAARRLADRLPSDEDRATFAAALAAAREALRIAEDDDALFFRAQRLVRRALHALGRRAADAQRLDAADQIFELPIADALTDRLDASRARANRSLREAQARAVPPALFRDGAPSWHGPIATDTADVLVGSGTAGRAWGRALVLTNEAEAPRALAPGTVLVVSAVLPSLTWLLPGAVALVTDVGGALSHAATLAREYGIPAVLGTAAATHRIATGDELIVDGDHGRVYLLRLLGTPG